MNFENVYWDADDLSDAGYSASILAIGDSWFWYPFPGGSLLNQIGPVVAAGQHTILAMGYNGAEIYDYVQGKYRSFVKLALEHHGQGLSAVFLSGGGNDFAGFNDLRPLLASDCSKAKTAKACFRPGNGDHTINWLMQKTGEHYTALIGQIFVHTPAEAKVFVHNYDYALPSGKGVLGTNWLKPALVDARVPAKLRHPCIKYLIDQFTKVLEDLAGKNPRRIHLVDSRNTLARADWANELHPKPGGFKKIAVQRWKPALEAVGVI